MLYKELSIDKYENNVQCTLVQDKKSHRTQRKEKRAKYDIINKLQRSVFEQILAVSHRLAINNNNLT